MKIRTGFVSNSSSTSFTIPCSLLTDEQKEALLMIDCDKETKSKLQAMCDDNNHDFENSKNDYPINKEYHRIYKKMIDDDEWEDYDWDTGESQERQTIEGTALMWNGSIEIFMKKIGIDPTMVEIINHGHMTVQMATHPKAVKHRIWMHELYKKNWAELSDKDQKYYDEYCGIHPPAEKNPYELDDSEFKPVGDDSLEYQEKEDEGYSYMKDKKS